MIKTYQRPPKNAYNAHKVETAKVPILPSSLEAEYKLVNNNHCFSYTDTEGTRRSCSYSSEHSLYDACRAFVKRIAEKGTLVLRMNLPGKNLAPYTKAVVEELHAVPFGDDMKPQKKLDLDDRIIEILEAPAA